ncbi:MAG TPA: hypothetical protein VJB94_01335 [Candidatus Nanoarchaeia archaeon]|nr:hypothetical protein [Candidatus Nanoarchaeia archaeon]
MPLRLVKGGLQKQQEKIECTSLVLVKDEFHLENIIKRAKEFNKQEEIEMNTPISFKNIKAERVIDDEVEQFNPYHKKTAPLRISLQIKSSTLDKKSVLVKYSCGLSCVNECSLGEEYVPCGGTGNLTWELSHKKSPLYKNLLRRVSMIAAAGVGVSILEYQRLFR